jgi:hypothetical protein
MSSNDIRQEIDQGGQVAIVTGAGRGIGRAMVQVLAEASAAVAVLARSEDQLTETVALIEGAGGCAIALPAAYAVRATGDWIEGFGAAQLVNGLATLMFAWSSQSARCTSSSPTRPPSTSKYSSRLSSCLRIEVESLGLLETIFSACPGAVAPDLPRPQGPSTVH